MLQQIQPPAARSQSIICTIMQFNSEGRISCHHKKKSSSLRRKQRRVFRGCSSRVEMFFVSVYVLPTMFSLIISMSNVIRCTASSSSWMPSQRYHHVASASAAFLHPSVDRTLHTTTKNQPHNYPSVSTTAIRRKLQGQQ